MLTLELHSNLLLFLKLEAPLNPCWTSSQRIVSLEGGSRLTSNIEGNLPLPQDPPLEMPSSYNYNNLMRQVSIAFINIL